MITSRGWLRATIALVGLSAVLAPTAPASATTTAATSQLAPALRRALPEPPPADVARDELENLNVEAPHAMTGYSRAKFPHWARQYGECDTREVVLQRDGTDVVQDDKCRAVQGTWHSEYDGKTLTAASQVDIDHMVPLAAGWRAGADLWDTAKRKAFANDLTHSQLIAVSAASNRSKGDQTPDLWKPPLKSYWCTYSRAWIDVKHVYELNVTDAEKAALGEMLDTCGS
ncbi:GmrSD restriction endonuclease domain-containing protein [Streptomyces violascens]|uniref:GmrSD restriction endonuclease domain-containing protein n=1 Tax=Streptomyces violascens TaxID=67381 RepID=UPI003653C766